MLDFVVIFLTFDLGCLTKVVCRCPLITAMGFLGAVPISGVSKERVTLWSGFSGEKRPEWVLRAKS